MQTSRLELQGLKCGGCSEIIQRAMKTVVGVNECTVNLDAKQAIIQFDPQLVTLETLQKSLASVGYPAQLVDEAVKPS